MIRQRNVTNQSYQPTWCRGSIDSQWNARFPFETDVPSAWCNITHVHGKVRIRTGERETERAAITNGTCRYRSIDQNGWAPLAVGKQYCIVFVCLARQILATISLMVLVERGWWSIVSVVGAVKRLRSWAFRERVRACIYATRLTGLALVHKHAIRMSPSLLARCVIRGWVCLSIRPYRAVCACSPCLKNVGIPVCANSSLLRTMYTGHSACVRAFPRSRVCQRMRAHTAHVTKIVSRLRFPICAHICICT